MVVKKCPKLYIYNIGGGLASTQPSPVYNRKAQMWPQNAPPQKAQKGERELTKSLPLESPRHEIKRGKNPQKLGSGFIEGRTRVLFNATL